MKGIVLAGGTGSRLHPVTLGVSKQLVPVYNKPMVYYPLATLMLAGITEILIICLPRDTESFRRVLGDGSWLGLDITYAEQPVPNGLAEAFLIGADHIGDDAVALILGDNIFHGHGFSGLLQQQSRDVKGCVLFGYEVSDPHRHGIGEVDDTGRLISIEEKPVRPRSNRAITGLYLYDNDVVEIAGRLTPSARGELEITDVSRAYLERGQARVIDLGRGFAWLDTGTHASLLDAAQYVRTLEERQGVQIACLEEIAMRMGTITPRQCRELGERAGNSAYARYIIETAESLIERN